MSCSNNTESELSSSDNESSTQGSPSGVEHGSTGMMTASPEHNSGSDDSSGLSSAPEEDPAAENPEHGSGSEDSSGLSSAPEEIPHPENPEHDSGSEESSGLSSAPEENPAPENPAVTGTAQASSHPPVAAETPRAPLRDLAVAERHQPPIGSVSAPDQESLSGDHHNNKGLEVTTVDRILPLLQGLTIDIPGTSHEDLAAHLATLTIDSNRLYELEQRAEALKLEQQGNEDLEGSSINGIDELFTALRIDRPSIEDAPSADQEHIEASTPADQQSIEASSPADRESTEPSSPEHQQSAKASSPTDRQSIEASSPADRESTEPSSPADRQSSEVSSTADPHSVEASSSEDQESVEASSTGDQESVEASSTADPHSIEASSSADQESEEASSTEDLDQSSGAPDMARADDTQEVNSAEEGEGEELTTTQGGDSQHVDQGKDDSQDEYNGEAEGSDGDDSEVDDEDEDSTGSDHDRYNPESDDEAQDEEDKDGGYIPEGDSSEGSDEDDPIEADVRDLNLEDDVAPAGDPKADALDQGQDPEDEIADTSGQVSSVPKEDRLKGKNFHDIKAFNKVLSDLGLRKAIIEHLTQWEALRSFESWSLMEEANERSMTPAEREAFKEASEWMPEDRKAWHEMTWEDWLTLWGHWMTINYDYLHASLNDVDRRQQTGYPSYHFETCTNPSCEFTSYHDALQGMLHQHVTMANGNALPRGGVQVPVLREGIKTLHPVERWHVKDGNRWHGSNASKLFEIEWKKPWIAKVQLRYLKVKKYTPTMEDLENDDWTWISDLEDGTILPEKSGESEAVSAVSSSSSEGEPEVEEGMTVAARRKAERKAAAEKKQQKQEAKAKAAQEAQAKQAALKARQSSRKAARTLYLSRRGTHWGIHINEEEPEALTLVKEAAALQRAKLDKAKRKAGRAADAAKAKAAEKAAKKAAERGEEAEGIGPGAQITSPFETIVPPAQVTSPFTTTAPVAQVTSPFTTTVPVPPKRARAPDPKPRGRQPKKPRQTEPEPEDEDSTVLDDDDEAEPDDSYIPVQLSTHTRPFMRREPRSRGAKDRIGSMEDRLLSDLSDDITFRPLDDVPLLPETLQRRTRRPANTTHDPPPSNARPPPSRIPGEPGYFPRSRNDPGFDEEHNLDLGEGMWDTMELARRDEAARRARRAAAALSAPTAPMTAPIAPMTTAPTAVMTTAPTTTAPAPTSPARVILQPRAPRRTATATASPTPTAAPARRARQPRTPAPTTAIANPTILPSNTDPRTLTHRLNIRAPLAPLNIAAHISLPLDTTTTPYARRTETFNEDILKKHSGHRAGMDLRSSFNLPLGRNIYSAYAQSGDYPGPSWLSDNNIDRGAIAGTQLSIIGTSRMKMEDMEQRGVLRAGDEFYVRYGAGLRQSLSAEVLGFSAGAVAGKKTTVLLFRNVPDTDGSGGVHDEVHFVVGPIEVLAAFVAIEPLVGQAEDRREGAWKGIRVRRGGREQGTLFEVRQAYWLFQCEMDEWADVAQVKWRSRRGA
ncbi:MAG: hypothetical protein Q9195_005705 [Heterodermia aff. obscurata]